MKKVVLIALAILGTGIATSKADASFSISFGHHQRAPRVYAQAPVYVPAPVVVESHHGGYYSPRVYYGHQGYHQEQRQEHAGFHHQQKHEHDAYHHAEFHGEQNYHHGSAHGYSR